MRFQSYVCALLFGSLLRSQEPGTVAGSVFDAQTGQPLRGVQIAVDGHSGNQATDTQGRFAIKLSPGQYKLSFSLENYAPTAVDQVQVKAGEIVDGSTVMSNKNLVTSVDVVEKATPAGATAEAVLTERKLAAVVSDAISGDDIRKSVAPDAAGAVEKVTGVSVQENGYVFVRGLGERYSSTMLNNAVIPTTEPEKRVVPLDLFPANLIDNIKVLKTYSPELPGEFSGGVVQMRTIEFPNARTLRVSVSSGFNTATTFNNFGSYKGGGRDFFGFDNGSRSIPGVIPGARLFAGSFSDQQFQTFGRAFNPDWELSPAMSMRPSLSYSMAGGDSFLKGKLGVVGAVSFTNQPQRTVCEPETSLTSVPVGG